MLEKAGLELGSVEEITGSVWAPDRIMMIDPEPGTEVQRGTSVSISVTDDWLCGPQTVEVAAAW